MTRQRNSFLSALLLLFAVCFAGLSASASHLRGTSVSWQPTGTPGTVQFNVQYSQRASAGCDQGTCAVGSTIAFPFYYGDGNATDIEATVTSLNSAEDYFSAVATFTYTYSGTGPYVAYYEDCCRVSTIKSGSGATIRMETTVTPFASPVNHPPVVSMPAIVTVPLQANTGFTVSAADQDHDLLQFRLATASEMYDSSPFSCSMEQPPGLSINNAGQVTWDTTQITSSPCGFAAPVSGDLWTVQFMVEDLDSNGNVKSKTPLDIILKFVSSTEAMPTLSFSNPGPITVAPGTPVSFTVTGDDSTANSRVTLNATGLPVGATATNTNQALIPAVTSTFNWTPGNSDGGNYIITYTATNDTMEQVIGSLNITVLQVSPPVTTCSANLTGQYNASISIPLQVSDPQGDAITVVWSVDGNVAHTDNVAASASTTNLSLPQTFTSVGTHTVSMTATDTQSMSNTCSTTVTVNKADQTISFGNLSSMTYGDPDLPLTGSSSSGDAVSFAASGSCSVVNGAAHITGAGSCSITASQAGDANYNAAPPVSQQITIAQHSLSVTAQNATRQYGAANPTFSGTVTGIVNNDAITATYATSANSSSLAGTYAIVPSLAGGALSNYAPTVNNGTLTVTPAAPTKVVTSVPPATLSAGGNVGTLTATVEDVGGNTVTASTAPVTVIISGPNNFIQTLTVNAINGVATLNLGSVVLNTAGNYTVGTSSPGLSGTTATVTVTVGAATKLSSSVLPATVVSGGNLGALSTTVQDVGGNTVTGSSAPVTVTISGPNGYVHTLTVPAVNGVASFDLSSLALNTAGTYTVTTSGSGLTGTSSTVNVTAGQAAQASLGALPSSLTSGGNLGTISASVKDANGNVATSFNGTVSVTITGPNGYSQTVTGTVVNGVLSLNLGALGLQTAGTYTITMNGAGLTASTSTLTVYPGAAAKVAAGSVPVTVVAGGNLGTITGTVQDTYANTVTSSTASVTATITGPNGYSQTVVIPAVNGVATLNLNALPLNTAGTYTVVTSSAGLGASTSTVTVTPGTGTQITLGAVAGNIISGQSLGTMTATVKDANGNVATGYTGSITATLTGPNGFSQTVTGTVVNGVVTLDLSALNPTAAGTYTLTTAGSGLTPTSTTIVIAQAAQAIAMPSLPNVTYGAPSVTLPATTSAGLPISYVVTGPAVLNGSTLTSTGAGTVTVSATQAGDSAHSPISATTSFSVAQAVSATSLSTSSGVAISGAPVTLTAQVTSGAGVPTGTVTFQDGSLTLGTVPVTSTGSATLTLSTLPTGALNLTASYGGDSNFIGSKSVASVTAVQDFGIAAINGTPSVPVVPGASTSYTLSLTPGNSGFSSAIALTVTGLPKGATYSFSPASVTPGSAVVNTVLTVQTAKPVSVARNLGGAAGVTLALLVLPFGLSRRKREALRSSRLLSGMAVVLLLGSIAGLTGCGTSNGFLDQPEQSYSLTVTATSGTLSHSTTVVLNVQ